MDIDARHEAGTAPDRRSREIAELPAPRPLPFLGNLHQVRIDRLHQDLEARVSQYGPVYRFRFGPREVLVVADPIAIAGMLRDRPEGWRRTYQLESVFDEMGISGVFSVNDDTWRRQRKIVMAAFAQRHLKAYFPALVRVTERFHRRWSDHAARGRAFDVQSDLMRYTVDVVSGLAFGTDINTIDSGDDIIQDHLNVVFPMLLRRLTAPFAYWRWLRLPADRNLERHLSAVHAHVGELVSAARARLDAHPERRERPENFLEALISARDTDGSGLSDRDVTANVITMLLAGEDTTALTLAWLLHLVSAHPAIVERLAREARAVLGADAYPTTPEQVASLRFTEACAHETMRLKPVAPFLILQANHPTTVCDVAVPAGTVALMLLRPGATDERHFDHAAEFRPERWLSQAADAVNTSAERISMPFGAGARICPGRNLALQEIKMVTAMLFRNFDIAELAGAGGAPIEERLAFTMGPSQMFMRLAARP